MLRSGAAFVDVMQLGKSLDELAGHTSRIRELFRALDASAQPSAARLLPTPGDRISFRGVTVCAPEPGGEPRLLVRRLDLELPARRCLMITGPNGSGKTSTMRVLAGLWPPAEGTVTCPPQGILWLPQKPFLVSGTLRDQVTYPALAGSQRRFDSRVRDCLAKAGVAALGDSGAGLDREHAEWDDVRALLACAGWATARGAHLHRGLPLPPPTPPHSPQVLSGGERQRVGFARLFYHAPRYAILDEATSACNAEGEASLYAACLEEGITLLSIAHRMELRRFHSAELRLVGDGSGAWTLTELVDGAPAAAAAAHGAPGALRAAAAASAP